MSIRNDIKKEKEAGEMQYLEIPHAILPAPLANTAVRLPRSIGILERTAVQRHADDHLGRRHAVLDIITDSLLGVERGAIGIVVAGVQVSLVAGARVPRPGKVVRHQVNKVEVLRHGAEVQLAVVLRARRRRDGEQEARVRVGAAVAQLRGVGVELAARLLEEQVEVARLGVVLRVLPVDVEPVEAEVLEQLHGRLGEALAAGGRRGGRGEVGAVGPAADGEQDLEVAVALLEEVELLDAAVDVGADVVPGVARVVLLDVGPAVRHVSGRDVSFFSVHGGGLVVIIHFTGVRSHVGKGIEHVGQFLGREILRVVLTTVDCLGKTLMSVLRCNLMLLRLHQPS